MQQPDLECASWLADAQVRDCDAVLILFSNHSCDLCPFCICTANHIMLLDFQWADGVPRLAPLPHNTSLEVGGVYCIPGCIEKQYCAGVQVPFSLVFTKTDKRKKKCPSPRENIQAFQVRALPFIGHA